MLLGHRDLTSIAQKTTLSFSSYASFICPHGPSDVVSLGRQHRDVDFTLLSSDPKGNKDFKKSRHLNNPLIRTVSGVSLPLITQRL